jgi:hypothetical protein
MKIFSFLIFENSPSPITSSPYSSSMLASTLLDINDISYKKFSDWDRMACSMSSSVGPGGNGGWGSFGDGGGGNLGNGAGAAAAAEDGQLDPLKLSSAEEVCLGCGLSFRTNGNFFCAAPVRSTMKA